ncbi:hypothetical protein OE88DRAFT_1684649 [Heliocybe sulcata]|uniref:Phosphatidate phosphatase APP1 catalytic domain-containing protein n=1 Tax=Heliocybe sulcata TaxID=5364 RepID=A0A5C3MUS3_9AGAM|nr:hypothetical protein OE88DRAFT_1684649 [Heliocybe sulcata]
MPSQRCLAFFAAVGASLVAAAPQPQVASSITSEVGSAFSSATGAAASALPTVLGDWPSLSDIESKIGVSSSSDLSNISASALLIPSYSNYTEQGWNVRFYGLVYKLPNVSTSDLDSIINGLSTSNLNDTQQALLQNRTQDLASVPIANANISAVVYANGSAVTDQSGIAIPTTDEVGEFDYFTTIPGLHDNFAATTVVETGILDVTGPGNGTSILVPSSGISVVSDIDDVLRITKVYVPNEGLYNSFVQPYINVPGMTELFAHWLQTLPGVSFHYDTTTPVELTRTYVEYLFNNFPLGSLDMRPINITEPSQVLDARQNSLLKLFQTFPNRKFVLVGDTSSSTLLSAYPQISTQFPNQLACIFIRNTSSTDSDDKIPYNTKEFQNVSSDKYFFYRVPEDLFNLDIANGQCVNSSIPQNVTFGEQGGVLGNNGNSAAGAVKVSALGVMAAAVLGAVALL